MLDADLASLYGVEPRVLVQAVKRNIERFPRDFAFQLTAQEFRDLRSQSVTSSGVPKRIRSRLGSPSWGGRRYPPFAFTEQGVAMLSSVLRSDRAVRVNIEIMRAFVRLRQLLSRNADLSRKVEAMEQRYDEQFKIVFEVLKQLMDPPRPKRRRIGFDTLFDE